MLALEPLDVTCVAVFHFGAGRILFRAERSERIDASRTTRLEICPETSAHYSCRKASIRLTRAARQAGTAHVASARQGEERCRTARVTGSVGWTPNSRPRNSRPTTSASTSPQRDTHHDQSGALGEHQRHDLSAVARQWPCAPPSPSAVSRPTATARRRGRPARAASRPTAKPTSRCMANVRAATDSSRTSDIVLTCSTAAVGSTAWIACAHPAGHRHGIAVGPDDEVLGGRAVLPERQIRPRAWPPRSGHRSACPRRRRRSRSAAVVVVDEPQRAAERRAPPAK